MNELVLAAIAGAVTVREPEPEPEPGPALLKALGLVAVGDDPGSLGGCDPAIIARFITDAVRQEAGCILAWMAPRTARTPIEWIHAWLGRLNLALTFVLPEAELKLRTPAIVDALGTLPRAAFTPETLRLAKLEFRGFPGAKDVYDLLRGRVSELLATQRALRRIVDFKSPAVPVKPSTQAERDAVLAAFREKMRGARGPERSVADQIAALAVNSAARPAHLTPDQLREARAGVRAGGVISVTGG
jgi:hypothetical protein